MHCEWLEDIAKKLRALHEDVAAMECPFPHLLPPDEPPPATPAVACARDGSPEGGNAVPRSQGSAARTGS